MKKLLCLHIMSGLFVSTLTYAINPDPIDLFLQYVKPVNRITANFTQKTVSNGQVTQESSGEMAIEKPGKFYWLVKGISEQEIIANGKQIWIYDKDLKQVTIKSMQQPNSDVPALLLAGSENYIKDNYIINLVKSTEHRKIFRLLPKNPQSLFQSVLMTFQNKVITDLVFVDNLNQQTKLQFSNVKINPALKKNYFHFTPPKGVDVIKQAG